MSSGAMSSGAVNERDRRRQALIDELRRLHRAEPAPAELRRRLLERAAEDAPQRLGTTQGWMRLRWPFQRVALAALVLLAVVLALRGGHSGGVQGGGVQGGGRADGALAPRSIEIALGPEPRSGAALRAEPSEPPDTASGPCPLDELPRGAVLMPGKSGAPGLTVHTFEQQTASCGPITRRYLERLPSGLLRRADAPVVILLHDAGESAEVMHAQNDRLNFEQLAQRSGIVLIYANAAPGAATSVGVADSGAWQTHARAGGQVDDVKYLQRIVLDLTLRDIIGGGNEVFLVGYGDGAAMALDAAVRSPDRYTGVAAFVPPDVADVDPVLARTSGRLSRVMLVMEAPSHASADAWRLSLPMLTRRWGRVLGVEQKVIGHIWKFGDPKRPMGTLEQFDVSQPASGSSGARIYLLDGVVETPPSAAHAWDFLRGVDGADLGAADDLPDLATVPPQLLMGDDLELIDDLPIVLEEEVLTVPRGATRSEP